MNKSVFLAAWAVAISTSPSMAGQHYFGASAGQFTIAESGTEAEPAYANLHYGIRYNPYVAAELRMGMGLGDDSVNVAGTAVEVELKQLLGAYLQLGIPLSENVYPYVLLGASHVKATASVAERMGRVTASEERDSVSYGFGVALDLGDELSVRLESTRYTDKDNLEMDGLSMGFSREF